MLKAGFARLDVTPPLGTGVTGYFEPRTSQGVLDPIYLNAIALNDGQNTALIIAGDFLHMMESVATEYRELIESETGIEKSNIMIHCIHQHTSTTPGSTTDIPREYADLLRRKFRDAAVLALADMAEATFSYAEEETAEPISFIRRFWMKDGTLVTNPTPMNPNIDHAAGEADNTVRLVKISRQNKKDIALVQFQTHPDVIGGNCFSADWPGFVRTYTETALPNVSCILINGFTGDVNHYNIAKPRPATPTERYAHSKYMGKVITDTVLNIWHKTEPLETNIVAAATEDLYMPANTSGCEDVDSSIRMYDAYKAGLIPKPQDTSLTHARRVSAFISRPIVHKIPVSVISLGKLALVGLPGEPFTEYATNIRAAFPDRIVLFATLTNGCSDYFPSASAYNEGGYEAASAVLPAQIVSALENTAIKMLNNI
jgi:hypothetical protein